MTSEAEQTVAYRGGQRWVQVRDAFEPDIQAAGTIRYKQGGVYLITGGLGGIGYRVAKYLATEFHARLVLIGRSIVDSKSPSVDEELSLKQQKIVDELNELGAEVMLCRGDVTDADQLRAILNQTKSRFQQIDGVFHAAGIAGNTLIHGCTRQQVAAVLEPKVNGIFALDEALGDERLDFLVCFSSVSAVFGGIGQVAYSAANAVLDAYAHSKEGDSLRPTVSINFDAWKDTGMASFREKTNGNADASAEDTLPPSIHEVMFKHALSVDDGLAALKTVLASPYPQMIVSRRDFEHADRLMGEQMRLLNAANSDSNRKNGVHSRRKLDVEYVEPQNEVERKLAAIWADVLGIDRVGTLDNFFDLGGDSLIGLQISVRIKQTFTMDLPVSYLFDEPTIKNLASIIAAGRNVPEAITHDDESALQHGEI